VCGRATLSASPEDLEAAFGLDEVPELPPRFNIAPTQPIAIIRQPRRLELVRWGIAVADAKRPGPVINVRVETVARAPAYRESFRRRRCLVIVDGFFEWQRLVEKKRQPFALRLGDGKPFALAGIWTESATADGELVPACAIITGPATGAVAPIHDRMPLVVPPEEYARWLDSEIREDVAHLVTLADRAAVGFVSYPVSTLVNSPDNDDPRCLEPVAEDAIPKGTLRLFE
jgi:putative SOS response-associated peptidase YedK